MKRVEIRYSSITKELEKLNARLERYEKAYEKKLAAAEKLGMANMTGEEHTDWLNSLDTNNGWLINKEDIKKNGAWFDLYSAEREVEDVKRMIANAEKRLIKAESEQEAYHKKIEEIADLKMKEELYKIEFEAEQKEWKKDGIILEGRYYGITPKGKRFYIYGNQGFTERSLHCVTLAIDGQTIFTSGEFWLAYATLKNR